MEINVRFTPQKLSRYNQSEKIYGGKINEKKKRDRSSALQCMPCGRKCKSRICRCIEGSNTWSRSYGCSEADNDEIF